MNRTLAHRGPDDEGYFGSPEGRVHLGHRRLSILDLSPGGHQPMASPAGNVTVFNGEIYNYRALRDRCPGHTFHSTSDTEVLLALYDREAEGCLRHLNGMFAFAIWDPARERLLLARDQIGIKPLYYTEQDGIFAFASELRALLALPWVRAELDHEALYDFLTFNHCVPPATMFRNIHKFHPGWSMTVGPRGIERYAPYWEINSTPLLNAPEAELVERVGGNLRRAVHGQMVSDVPVGAFLSGGVDSSAVVALMREVSTGPVRTYSIGFKDAPAYDEREHARRVAEMFKTDHHEKIVSREEIEAFVPRLAEVFDEPLADATSVPIYFLCEAARAHGTKVVLTGDGSDELFCGYRSWRGIRRLYPCYRALQALPGPIRSVIAELRHLLPEQHPVHELLLRAKNGQELFWTSGGIKQSAKNALLGPAMKPLAGQRSSWDAIRPFHDRYEHAIPARLRKDPLAWMSFLGLTELVPNFYLHRADRLGMAHSIELRVPFLDRELTDLSQSIPGRWKLKRGEPKYILKSALEPLLPHDLLYRRKMGFCVPLHEWMRELLTDFVGQRADRFCRDTGLLDATELRRLVSAGRAGDPGVTFGLWNVYFLLAWHERWIR